MISRISPFVLMIAAFFSAVAPAQAQIFGDNAVAPLQFGEQNSKLRQLLDLQYQIQLLNRLVQHETSVNSMIVAAKEIGMNDPVIPTPDLSICSALPANIPCAQAYSNLYENFSVEPVAMASVPMPAASTMVSSSDIPQLNSKALPELTAAVADIYWTDITCMAGKCSAVISPDPKNPSARYRIVPGEKLPNGSTVQMISAAGVALEQNNKIIQLAPAPRV